MLWLFSFEGRVDRQQYIPWAAGIFFSQHLFVLLSAAATIDPPVAMWSLLHTLDWQFYLWPIRVFAIPDLQTAWLYVFRLVYVVAVAWTLAALAFRRAVDARVDGWVAVLAIVPLLQLPILLFLSVFPSRPPRQSEPGRVTESDLRRRKVAAIKGGIAGVAASLVAVAVGALLFGYYGYGVFVVAPFVIGALTGYFANRKSDITGAQTAGLVVLTTGLGGIALISTALEGAICIVLASPLALGLALVGGSMGRALARQSRPASKQTLSACACLLLAFVAETALPTRAAFETVHTVEIDAAPAAVWDSIVGMNAMEAPTSVFFRLGAAYPVRAEIVGEGVGATRIGEFSTGKAIERITEWIPGRELAFDVLEDVPAIRELSPYDHVHAPHVRGYFLTIRTRFELLEQPDGGTKLVIRSSHELRLEPLPYWLPLAQWVVESNNARVLDT